jgi:hypothetical protein
MDAAVRFEMTNLGRRRPQGTTTMM